MQKNKFFTLAVLTFLVFNGCGGGSDSGSDSNLRTDACDVIGAKIINGTECHDAQSAVVKYSVDYSNGSGSSCSGTFISNRHILTAAHCFEDNGVNVEAVNITFGGRTIAASGFGVHPGFSVEEDSRLPSGVGFFNDAAIIELSRAVNVTPIPLLLSRPTKAGDIISIFGYGINETGKFGTLESGEMHLDNVLPDQLVSQFTGDGSNTCLGDSGGPAIITADGVKGIVGLTSSGDADKECQKGDNSLFQNTQATSVINFILQLAPDAARS